jgi:hypothetical protein
MVQVKRIQQKEPSLFHYVRTGFEDILAIPYQEIMGYICVELVDQDCITSESH